jgi:hypothetical protein
VGLFYFGLTLATCSIKALLCFCCGAKLRSMSLLKKLVSIFSQRRIDTIAASQAFLESRAAYLVQKSISEYSQARANMLFSALLSEKEFQDNYEAARWLSYPASLAMVAEVMAGALRKRLNIPASAATEALLQMAANIAQSMHGHGSLTGENWQEALEALSKNLSHAELAPPQTAHAIAKTRSHEIFDALPFHPSIKQHDFDMFRNTVTFHLAGIATELEEAVLTDGAANLSKNPLA